MVGVAGIVWQWRRADRHAAQEMRQRERMEATLGIDAGQTDKAERFTLRTVRCLGLCALSPAVRIDGRSFGRVNLDKVPEILEQFA